MQSVDKLRVLVVEDETDLLFLLERTLRAAGFEVEGCVDGNIALARALARPPDLFVLDWMLPGMDGLELCQRVKRDPRTAAVPVMLISARGGQSDVFRAIMQGADDCMVKPFALAEFVERVRQVVNQARPASLR